MNRLSHNALTRFKYQHDAYGLIYSLIGSIVNIMAMYYSSCPSSRQAPLPIRRYQVRGKTHAISDRFKIEDELGNDVFIVKSKVLSIGDNLILEDTHRK